eukprot:Skav225139  [mRNA]  locus=scaffold1056:121845:122536:+ [translate_table: standard]
MAWNSLKWHRWLQGSGATRAHRCSHEKGKFRKDMSPAHEFLRAIPRKRGNRPLLHGSFKAWHSKVQAEKEELERQKTEQRLNYLQAVFRSWSALAAAKASKQPTREEFLEA